MRGYVQEGTIWRTNALRGSGYRSVYTGFS